MKRLALLAVAAALAAYAAPASAQAVISDPGYCAQFYPNANCNNKGPNNPYTGDYQRRGGTNGQQYGQWDSGWSNARAQWDEPQQPTRRSRRDY